MRDTIIVNIDEEFYLRCYELNGRPPTDQEWDTFQDGVPTCALCDDAATHTMLYSDGTPASHRCDAHTFVFRDTP